ncbi:unnamed protein product [Acanthocheilonema viteae]|uniref:G-protein coupled receptors family 1 profile domain-containing protein n=1 Tax=Acanthocheilonema viteae TaxID=6277 RepID=A0A498S8Q0_ACAVI|nr:unnamed protein product [Acanthocheilonema viteae]
MLSIKKINYYRICERFAVVLLHADPCGERLREIPPYYMSVTWDQEAVQELHVPSLASEVSNIFTISLLLLLCATGLLGMWIWSFLMCLLYVYADVFLCTASIVHMSVISLDRYFGISKPLRARDKSETSIAVKLASVWIITTLISCPIAIMALIDSSNIFNDNTCRITNRYYMIYGSIFAFLIPFLIMAVTYIRTTTLLKQQPTIISHQGVATNNHTESVILRRTHTQRNYIPENLRNVISCKRNKEMIERPLQTTLLPIYSKKEVKLLEKNRLNFRRRAEMVIIAIGDKISRKEVIPKRNTELTNEHKATCVLAIVFACFFICWAPFFCANLAFGFCGEPCALPPTMEFFFLWLGYFSSIINPLIYTIFNRTTVDRPDSQWEQDRCTALSYNTNLHERKPSRQEHCVQSIHSDTSSPNRKIDLLEKTEQATMVNKEAIMNDQSQNTLSDICMIASSEGGKLSKHNKDSKNLKFFHNHGNVNVLKFSISEQGLAQAILFICFKPLREAPS